MDTYIPAKANVNVGLFNETGRAFPDICWSIQAANF